MDDDNVFYVHVASDEGGSFLDRDSAPCINAKHWATVLDSSRPSMAHTSIKYRSCRLRYLHGQHQQLANNHQTEGKTNRLTSDEMTDKLRRIRAAVNLILTVIGVVAVIGGGFGISCGIKNG